MPVHLHIRSSYSLLSSSISIKELVSYAKKLNYSALALVDTNVLFGTMEFFNECKANGIKPIIGLEFLVEIDNHLYAFEALCKNDNGYLDLIKLSSYLCSTKNYVTINELKTYIHDLYLIVYGENGYLEEALILNDVKDLENRLIFLKEELNNFDVALSFNDTEFWKQKNKILKKTCINLGIHTLALNKIYYLKEEDSILLKVLQGIKEQKTISDKTLVEIKGRYFRSKEDLNNIYDKDDLDRTDYISSICNLNLDIEKTSLPKFENNYGVDSKEYLRSLALFGLKKRLNDKVSKEYYDRLNYELDIITSMDFEDYFLIVYDFILFANKHGIYIGPGRGSASSSLVSYSLGIINIDPLKYDLLFERFLNPERISMPDIDTDFPNDRRDEVINYVFNKYGKQHIAHIITFDTLKAKQAIRDVSRVYELTSKQADMLSKSLGNFTKIDLNTAYNENLRFKQLIDSNIKFKNVFEIAKKLENKPRHISTHAAGIVMSNKEFKDIIPTIAYETNMLSTQFTSEYLESLGLIKMDFLGLKNLTMVNDIIDLVKINNPTFNLNEISLEDKNTFKLLQNVDTSGIFQLDSSGMKNLLSKVNVSTFMEIVDTIALFRPGPMENIPLYLERKNDKSKVEYPHNNLIPILKDTFGIMIYQEQIMQITQLMAGFSLGKADILRRAMSKKDPEKLNSLRNDFIDGCINNGYDKNLATDLFELIFKFSGYGFNKAHSVAYGLLAYQQAYLKANFPLEFYCSLLNSVIGDETKTSLYIDELKSKDINIIYFDINKSGFEYEIIDNKILLPLSIIKNVNSNSIAQIIATRRNKEFSDYFDFIARILGQQVNRTIIESLINAGALDNLFDSRKSMLNTLDEAIAYSELIRIDDGNNISLDLNLVSKPNLNFVKEDELARLERQKNVLGFYLDSNPISKIKEKYNINTRTLINYRNVLANVEAFGCISRVKEIRTKKGEKMAFISVEDETSNLELVIMPNKFDLFSKYLIKGKYIYFSGRINKENSCIVSNIKVFEEM